jgi:hypothetical protein
MNVFWRAGFMSLRARLLLMEEALMFDNEIDWVTYLDCPPIRREARRQAHDSRCV